MKKQDLKQVHLLRAVAALAVTVFHLYCGNPNLFTQTTAIKKEVSYGYLGVELFFLLSGFIICYALPQTYNLKTDLKTFLLKRITRIEPPYIISIVLLVIINEVATLYSGVRFDFSLKEFALHLGYLDNFGFGTYYNVVYWTLGIEFQFYLLIAFIFPFLINKSVVSVFLVLSALLALSLVHLKNMAIIFTYLPVFCAGFLVFLYRYHKSIDLRVYVAMTALSLALVWYNLDVAALNTTITGILILFFFNYSNRVINYFSKISYSLYLTHVFIGGKVVNLGLRFVNTNLQRYALFFIALGISVLSAHLFYLLIEKPSLKFSKRYRYQNLYS